MLFKECSQHTKETLLETIYAQMEQVAEELLSNPRSRYYCHLMSALIMHRGWVEAIKCSK